MSTIQVDRIIPYQSSSVTIEGDVTVLGAATTGSNTFTGDQNIQGTLTASIAEGFALVGGVGNISTLVATSSFGEALPSGVVSGSSQITELGFATTGSNTFIGNQVISGSSGLVAVEVSGSVNQTFPVPGSNLAANLMRVTGGVAPGTTPTATYNFIKNSWNNAQFGNSYLGWTFENWNENTYGYGNDTVIGPTGFFHDMYASGSGQNAQLRIRDNYNGTTFAQLYAGTVRIGNVTTTELTIGRTALDTVISGSVSVEKVLTLTPQDPLPAGAVGQVAVSGSNLYFYTDQWREVAFV